MLAAPHQSIVFLPTISLQKTHAFYHDKLGLCLARDQGSCRIYRVREGAYIGFCEATLPMLECERVIVTMVVDDVAGWQADLEEKGVPNDGPPRISKKYAIEHFFATDPNGYRVEFQRFLEPLD